MAALISSKVWFLFIALTVVVVVGSPTTDLLESVDCLLRHSARYFTNADRNNDQFSYHTLIAFHLPLFPCSSTLIVIFVII